MNSVEVPEWLSCLRLENRAEIIPFIETLVGYELIWLHGG